MCVCVCVYVCVCVCVCVCARVCVCVCTCVWNVAFIKLNYCHSCISRASLGVKEWGDQVFMYMIGLAGVKLELSLYLFIMGQLVSFLG